MSGWISAKDHDLLLPASKGDGLSSEVAKSRSDSLQTLELGPSASSSDGMLPAIDASSLSDSKQAPNPYVAELELTPAAQVTAFAAPEIAAFAPADTPEVPRAATVNGMDSGPSDPSHSFIPDFAQPSDDDKYYRQMKRF
jgi:hypothetical protein